VVHRWVPVLIVVALIALVVGGAQVLSAAVTAADVPPVRVGAAVQIQPRPGWEVLSVTAAPPSARLHRGPVVLTVLAMDPEPLGPGAVADRYVEQQLGQSLSQLAVATQDPTMANVLHGLVAAGAALPDFGAAMRAIKTIDPASLEKLRQRLFGDSMETAAKTLIKNRGVGVVVLGHTHSVGGFVKRVDGGGYYANTGSWISVASVAELRAKGIGWDQLSILDRATLADIIGSHDIR